MSASAKQVREYHEDVAARWSDGRYGDPTTAPGLQEVIELHRSFASAIAALEEREKLLSELLLECIGEIEAEVMARYPFGIDAPYPDEVRRYNNDMDLPRRCRAALSGERTTEEEA
jgi:hypothetical protein